VQRRPVSPFSLSFLDIMFCGFGAVVLLVLILNADTVQARNARFADLRGEVIQRESQLIVARERLAADAERLVTMTRARHGRDRTAAGLQAEIAQLAAELAGLQRDTASRRERIAALRSRLAAIESELETARAQATAPAQGRQVHAFRGDGDRQYLSGLKLGGRRILILLDASASMLDESVVNVIRLRHMNAQVRRGAPKWQRAVATVEWLVSQLPVDSQFQLYTFDTSARAAAPGTMQRWLAAANRDDIDASIAGLHETLAADGTSLENAFRTALELTPRPDNILLVTDGLPTQGRRAPQAATVSSDQRLDHFARAVKLLPAGIPVNTILLPMEGDAYAAAAYWQLAVQTRGAFITPARDWP